MSIACTTSVHYALTEPLLENEFSQLDCSIWSYTITHSINKQFISIHTSSQGGCILRLEHIAGQESLALQPVSTFVPTSRRGANK